MHIGHQAESLHNINYFLIGDSRVYEHCNVTGYGGIFGNRFEYKRLGRKGYKLIYIKLKEECRVGYIEIFEDDRVDLADHADLIGADQDVGAFGRA